LYKKDDDRLLIVAGSYRGSPGPAQFYGYLMAFLAAQIKLDYLSEPWPKMALNFVGPRPDSFFFYLPTEWSNDSVWAQDSAKTLRRAER
jgi:hypothetical protein